ncbi:MAG: glycosyl hydrolase family 65 protein, partial [Blastocatellia bacterium]
GWTWYTGSAGWLHRAGLEWIRGFRLRGRTLSMDPCFPREWPGYAIRFRYHSAVYKITVENPRNVSRGVVLTELDRKAVAKLLKHSSPDDGSEHQVRIVLGKRASDLS